MWSRAGRAAAERTAVVFNAGTKPDFQHHFDVESRPGVKPLSLKQLALVFQDFQPLFELALDRVDGAVNAILRHHKVLGRINEHFLFLADDLAARRIDDRELLDVVPPKLDAQRVFFITRPKLHTVATDAELAARELDVVPLVLNVD